MRKLMAVTVSAVTIASIYPNLAAAQSITNGGLTGVMVTRAALVNASTTISFLSVPPNHYFILTQACYTFGTGTNLRFNGLGGAVRCRSLLAQGIS
jgi:hypothetical protein